MSDANVLLVDPRERRWSTPEEIGSVFRSADAREGAIAFAERRQPRWTGQ